MDIGKFLEIMDLAENLKNNPRHSWTSSGRRESVADAQLAADADGIFCER